MAIAGCAVIRREMPSILADIQVSRSLPYTPHHTLTPPCVQTFSITGCMLGSGIRQDARDDGVQCRAFAARFT